MSNTAMRERSVRTLISMSNSVEEADSVLSEFISNDISGKLAYLQQTYPNIRLFSRERPAKDEIYSAQDEMEDDYWAFLASVIN